MTTTTTPTGQSQYKHLPQQRQQPRLDLVVVVDQHPVVEVEDQLAVQAVAVVVLRVEDWHQCIREYQRSHLH